jgi:hypothetical protein
MNDEVFMEAYQTYIDLNVNENNKGVEKKLPSLYRKVCCFCQKPHATLVCSLCGFTRYCSRTCQRKHWRQDHKENCAKIKKWMTPRRVNDKAYTKILCFFKHMDEQNDLPPPSLRFANLIVASEQKAAEKYQPTSIFEWSKKYPCRTAFTYAFTWSVPMLRHWARLAYVVSGKTILEPGAGKGILRLWMMQTCEILKIKPPMWICTDIEPQNNDSVYTMSGMMSVKTHCCPKPPYQKFDILLLSWPEYYGKTQWVKNMLTYVKRQPITVDIVYIGEPLNGCSMSVPAWEYMKTKWTQQFIVPNNCFKYFWDRTYYFTAKHPQLAYVVTGKTIWEPGTGKGELRFWIMNACDVLQISRPTWICTDAVQNTSEYLQNAQRYCTPHTPYRRCDILLLSWPECNGKTAGVKKMLTYVRKQQIVVKIIYWKQKTL